MKDPTMSHTPHKLPEEFPEHIDLMHNLLANDAHFVKMHDEYDSANDAVHLAETDVKPTSDAHMADLRKERMRIKDQIYAYLATK
mgnify:CR=1 FL=1